MLLTDDSAFSHCQLPVTVVRRLAGRVHSVKSRHLR